MKKLEHLTPDQLADLTVEYKRYRRDCSRMRVIPLSISKWMLDSKWAPAPAPAEAIELEPKPQKTKAKKEVVLDEIFELNPMVEEEKFPPPEDEPIFYK